MLASDRLVHDAAPDPAAAPALRLAGVTIWEWDERTRRRVPILSEVSWEVAAGEQWAVLGPNGAGKSTLVDVAAGMRHPSRGEVAILGETVGQVDLRALRERIMARLQIIHAPPVWVEMVQHKVTLDAATERRLLGESLPPGLVLIG